MYYKFPWKNAIMLNENDLEINSNTIIRNEESQEVKELLYFLLVARNYASGIDDYTPSESYTDIVE